MKVRDVFTFRALHTYLVRIGISGLVLLFLIWQAKNMLYRWETTSYTNLFPAAFGTLTLLEDQQEPEKCHLLAFALDPDHPVTPSDLLQATGTRHADAPLALLPWWNIGADRPILGSDIEVRELLTLATGCGQVHGPAQIELTKELETGEGYMTHSKGKDWVIYFSAAKQRVFYLTAELR